MAMTVVATLCRLIVVLICCFFLVFVVMVFYPFVDVGRISGGVPWVVFRHVNRGEELVVCTSLCLPISVTASLPAFK
jgi:hypothetical protein